MAVFRVGGDAMEIYSPHGRQTTDSDFFFRATTTETTTDSDAAACRKGGPRPMETRKSETHTTEQTHTHTQRAMTMSRETPDATSRPALAGAN